MLASSSVGTIEFRSIVEPIRDANPTVSFLEGKVVDIDPATQKAEIVLKSSSSSSSTKTNSRLSPTTTVTNSSSTAAANHSSHTTADNQIELSYDVAVYACGVRAGGSGNGKVPGVSPANCHFLKDVSDALQLRVSVGNLLERASRPGLSDEVRRSLLHFVVV